MTKSFNVKALGAFWKLGAVALIIATLAMFFTACNQTGNTGGGGGKPKQAVTFSVEGGNGTLKAKVEGEATETEASPITVEEGKTVTFTAKASKGYRVSTWVISPSEALQSGGEKGNETAKVKITADTQVSVNFELIPEEVVLTLDPNKLTIGISAKTADGKPIEVEGCTETTFASDEDAELHATGTVVTLRGKITKFECNDNQLVALNVKNLTSLEELLCRKNQLTDLDASGLTALKTLGCNSNQLKSLNVSGCTALEKLGCFRNQLTSLNVLGCTALEELGCHGNQLTTVDISGLTALKRISCYTNQLNAEEMTKLLKALPAREASNDVKATLYTEKTGENEGNCKDFSQSETLKAAFKEARGRNWKLLKEKTDGTEVDILLTYAINFGVEGSGGKLSAQADGVAETETSPINVEEGKTVTFTAKADAGYKLKGWTLDGSAVNGTAETYTLAITQPATIKVSFEVTSVEGGAVLILSPDQLNIKIRVVTADSSDIAVEGCTETTLKSDEKTVLHAKGTKIVLKGNITKLDCDDNKLTELNVQGLTSLQKLNCSYNKLTALNMQGLTALQELYCDYNQLTSLNVQGLTALRVLGCDYNQLTELNVQDLTKLRYLSCGSNKLTALNMQGCTAFKVLYCYNNELTELNVQGLTALKEFECYCNQLNAKAMTKLLNALPAREASDNATAGLYTEVTSVIEGNCKDYTQPAELKKAVEDAKKRNWKLRKVNASGRYKDI